jgi:hypothetical protein
MSYWGTPGGACGHWMGLGRAEGRGEGGEKDRSLAPFSYLSKQGHYSPGSNGPKLFRTVSHLRDIC